MNSSYNKLQMLYMNIAMHVWFTLIFFFTDKQVTLGRKIAKICLFIVMPIYLIIAISITLLMLVCYIVNFIPLVRAVMVPVMYILLYFSVPFEMLLTSLNRQRYKFALTQLEMMKKMQLQGRGINM
jgi:hypothetical protein